MTSGIEKRLCNARKARDWRLADREIPTIADRILDGLDTLPGLLSRLSRSRAWAAPQDERANLCAQLRQGVASGWVTGPKKK